MTDWSSLVNELKDALRHRERVSLGEELLMAGMLAESIRRRRWGKPDLIFAVSPGGEMVAAWLSRRFLGTWKRPIPVRTVVVKTQRIKTAQGIIIRQAIVDEENTPLTGNPPDGFKVLLVTDISRSGMTLDAAYRYLVNYYGADRVQMAALMCHVNSGTELARGFCVVTTDKDVRFEWKEED